MVAVGQGALESNTTANHNVAVGSNALNLNTTGQYNTSLGSAALQANTTADANTSVGYGSLYTNTTGASNTAVGVNVLTSNTTASNNTAIGFEALQTCTTGANNTAVGYKSLDVLSTGSNVTAIGYEAGDGVTGASGCVYVGHKAGKDVTSGGQQLYIGCDSASAGNDDTWIYGNDVGACTQGNNSSTWTTTSDRRLKKNIVDNGLGLGVINQIRVRDFEYRLEDEIDISEFPLADNPHQVVLGKGNEGAHTGVIAQEIEEVLPKCIEVSARGAKTVKNDPITWALVNAVKELSAKNDALEARIKTLEG